MTPCIRQPYGHRVELIGTVGVDTMIAEYLRAEIDSPRFGFEVRRTLDELCLNEALVRQPDIANPKENAARAAVLGRWRGYGHDRDMFAGVPIDLIWFQASLTREDIGALRCVDYSYWNELTGGSRLVRDAVRRVRSGVVVFNVSNHRFVELAADISEGRAAFGPLIVWGRVANGPLELIEGHLRATALGLAGSAASDCVPAIVGLVDAPNQAGQYMCAIRDSNPEPAD